MQKAISLEGDEMVRIPTLPPTIFIKALIFQGFFGPECFWSPIWSPIFISASLGALRIVVDVLRSWELLMRARMSTVSATAQG